MKIAVRYFSRGGNTKKLAEAIAGAVGAEALTVAEALNEKVDMLFLGSSVYAGGVDESVKSFIRENGEKIGKIYNFSTAAVVPSTYAQVKKLAEECAVELAEEEFHCRGSFLILHKGRPNGADLAKAAEFAINAVKK